MRFYAALIGALLVRSAVAATGEPASLFERLETVPYVLVATVGECAALAEPRLSRCALRDVRVLRGVPPEPLPEVVEELVFSSDRPGLRRGEAALLLLGPLPAHSRFTAALGAGPFLTPSGGRAGCLPAQAAGAVERYLAALAQPAGSARDQARLDSLIAALSDAHTGDEAVQALAATEELNRKLDGPRAAALAAAMADRALPVERRRALLELAGTRRLERLRPALRAALSEPDLAPFARAALARFGEKVDRDAVRADLAAPAPAARIAAVHATAALPVGDRIPLLASAALRDADFGVRGEAIAALQRSGPPAVPALAQVLEDADSRVCYRAAEALAAVGDRPALDALARQFEGKSHTAQVAAVFALRRNASPAALEILGRVRKSTTDERLIKVLDAAAGVGEHEH